MLNQKDQARCDNKLEKSKMYPISIVYGIGQTQKQKKEEESNKEKKNKQINA